MRSRITILDGYAVNPGDLDWSPLAHLGDLKIYDRTSHDEIVDRAKESDYLLVNKVALTEELICSLPNLKCICLLATGYNNVDIRIARSQGIDVCNAVGYSTASVAQHVFALILELSNLTKFHSDGVHQGIWSRSIDWCYWNAPLTELTGMGLGIYGLGKIGLQVALIGKAFGMHVMAHTRSAISTDNHIESVSLEELFTKSDVLSLHAPLTESNQGVVNAHNLSKMQSQAILINTSRGGLINEQDLADALKSGAIGGAGLDVLCQEPPAFDNPLFGVKNCIITPHIAWATPQSRKRLIESVAQNIAAHQKGNPISVVNN